MHILSNKLKHLKTKLKIWNKEVFDNVHHFVNYELTLIKTKINNEVHSDSLMNEEKNAQINLDEALAKHEIFWKGKARINWHMNGNRNSKYFHRITKIKNKTKLISSIRNNEEIITDPDRISEHIVLYYRNIFSSNFVLQDSAIVEEVIPNIIDKQTNRLLTMLPSKEEINDVFDLNNEGSPGPNGFGACFFQFYWDIIHKEVVASVLELFQTGWINPNYNANTLILIPKTPNVDSIDQYRPIALANFKFKVVTKVIEDMLARNLPNIISEEQRGFMRGRNVKDCIALASEAINVLDRRSFGGNLALKIDVYKAFDTLNWEFLIKVLKAFGFNDKFCMWISSILHSTTISISINGAQQGHFSCNRGVRQGDPLSPLLFVIAIGG